MIAQHSMQPVQRSTTLSRQPHLTATLPLLLAGATRRRLAELLTSLLVVAASVLVVSISLVSGIGSTSKSGWVNAPIPMPAPQAGAAAWAQFYQRLQPRPTGGTRAVANPAAVGTVAAVPAPVPAPTPTIHPQPVPTPVR